MVIKLLALISCNSSYLLWCSMICKCVWCQRYCWTLTRWVTECDSHQLLHGLWRGPNYGISATTIVLYQLWNRYTYRVLVITSVIVWDYHTLPITESRSHHGYLLKIAPTYGINCPDRLWVHTMEAKPQIRTPVPIFVYAWDTSFFVLLGRSWCLDATFR